MLMIILLLIPVYSFSQFRTEWVRSIEGDNDENINHAAVDTFGNVLVAGTFVGIIDADPGISVMNFTSAGASDMFIQKLNASGDLVWAKHIGGTDADQAKSISCDRFGNVYITGYFGGSVDLDPGAGADVKVSAGLSDIFIFKLSSFCKGNIATLTGDKLGFNFKTVLFLPLTSSS